MKPLNRLALLSLGPTFLVASASAQVPDLLNAIDAGGRSMATGGANSATNVDTLSAYYNPAGLAYLDTRAADLTFRNLPHSRTTLRGNLNDPDQDSKGHRGDWTIGHAGFATPVRDLLGRGSGTLAVAYTLGGYISDRARAVGTLDSDGGFAAQNYTLRRNARTAFYSLSYGKAMSSEFSYGLGLVVADQTIGYSQTGTLTDGTSAVPIDSRDSSNGMGVGVIAGALYTPSWGKEWTLGLSLRSPISLSGSDQYDRIPGRIIFGTTWRRDGYRNNQDYVLIGAQVQSFLGGASSDYFDRDSQTGFGFGAEYNLGIGSDRIPFRVGFTTLPGGGSGFGSRNAFTFGVGYRPGRFPVGLDLGFAVPEKGGSDISLAASYRFK